MAQEKPKILNWKQKLDQGVPLSPLEETQADADYNYMQRLREAEERKRFEELKNRGRSAQVPQDETNGGKK